MERIVDQVVNPKINSIFLPKVTEIVYMYLGLEQPKEQHKVCTEQLKIKTENLLPTDLEAVSPGSDILEPKVEKMEVETASLDDSKNDEEESPPFEPIEEIKPKADENSMDSHFSGLSGRFDFITFILYNIIFIYYIYIMFYYIIFIL